MIANVPLIITEQVVKGKNVTTQKIGSKVENFAVGSSKS